MSLIFRDQVSLTDRERIKKLVTQTLFFTPSEVAIAIELIDDKLAKGDNSEYIFLMAQQNEDPNSLVGYCCYGFIPGTQSSYHLYWIVVDKNKQNQKVGKQLLEHLEKKIIKKGGTRIYAETSGRELYLPTHQFYLRNHFILEARLKDYFSPNDDELIFSKVLE